MICRNAHNRCGFSSYRQRCPTSLGSVLRLAYARARRREVALQKLLQAHRDASFRHGTRRAGTFVCVKLAEPSPCMGCDLHGHSLKHHSGSMRVWEITRHRAHVQRENLESCSHWTDAQEKQLLGTNERCERMLLALDELTGLEGDARAHKRQRIDELNSLCTRLDSLKRRRTNGAST